MGLIGGMARTAVIAGTATAVGNRVSRRQANRWNQQNQSAYAEQAYAEPQYAQPQYAPPPAPAPAPASSPTDDMIEQLERLAQLRDQGILTEEEFAEQKTRLLAR